MELCGGGLAFRRLPFTLHFSPDGKVILQKQKFSVLARGKPRDESEGKDRRAACSSPENLAAKASVTRYLRNAEVAPVAQDVASDEC